MDFNKIFEFDYVLDKQIQNILTTHFQYVNMSNPMKYNFRCNVCGDSKKSERKKRGYILKSKNPWMYYCHNCHYEKPVTVWMKEYFPENYRQYIKESLMKNKDRVEHDHKLYEKQKIEKAKSDAEKEAQDAKYFTPILDGTTKIFDIARKMCQDRLIPEHIWHKWYVASRGTYRNRIIIPFFDNEDNIYYYQGRSIYSSMIPKYLSRRGEQHNNIYHYYTVDRSKPVMVLEGLIDSEFVENSIGMTGLKIDDVKLKDFPTKYFILDNDDSGNEKAIQLLNRGEYVFVWKKFLKDLGIPTLNNKKEKWDINDICIHLNRINAFTYEELKSYFTNSIFNEVHFK